MDDLSGILSLTFLSALLTSGIRLAIPIYLAALGEIVTERGGVLNLGLEGLMLTGALIGFMAAYYAEQRFGVGWPLAPWIGLAAGIVAGMAMGLILAILSVSLRTDQVVTSIMLVILGQGFTTYLYQQQFSSLTARVTPLSVVSIPGLSEIPVIGKLFFSHDMVTYFSLILLVLTSFFLQRTTWGINIRAAGELPAAAESSGVNVIRIRYAAVLIGAGFAGLGGAVLTVAQLGIFNEGITAGRGWIAVALVIFARWRPSLALAGALLFGIATALQYRIQTLNLEVIPYELLLMLPYVLTILVLLYNKGQSAAPAALEKPYIKE